MHSTNKMVKNKEQLFYRCLHLCIVQEGHRCGLERIFILRGIILYKHRNLKEQFIKTP